MKVSELKTVCKVISKVYVVENGYNTVIAEVIENCGCGFTDLIRIKPNYEKELNVIAKCMDICDISANLMEKNIQRIDECINRGYLIYNPDIAIVVDGIIE